MKCYHFIQRMYAINKKNQHKRERKVTTNEKRKKAVAAVAAERDAARQRVRELEGAVAAANAERDAARQAAADTTELTNALQRIRELEGEITRLNGEIARLNDEITRHRSEADHAGLLNLEGTSAEFRANAERMLDIRDPRIGNLVAQLLRA